MSSYYFAPAPENASWPDNWKEIVTKRIESMPEEKQEKWKTAPNHVFDETVRQIVQQQFVTEWQEIKTIDVNCKEWRDKTYGNTYYSARVTINYGMPNERGYCIPFQYGYSGASSEVAKKLFPESYVSLRMECERRGIILRENTVQAKKKETEEWGKAEFQHSV